MHLFLVAMSIVTKLILIKDVGVFSRCSESIYKNNSTKPEQFILEM